MIYITTIQIGDGSWHGSAALFILNWQDKVREFEKLSDTKNHFSEEWKLIMLQNAVHPLSELRQVKTTADQNKVAGVALTYESYFKLLYSAAVSYDEQFTNKRSTRRSAFTHDMFDSDDLALMPDGGFNIDTGVDTVLAHIANHSTSNVRLPGPQWYELSTEARDLWQSLSEADKAIILGSNKTNPPPSSHRTQRTPSSHHSSGSSHPSKKISSYVHEIAIEDEDPITVSDTSLDHDDPTDASNAVLLANVTKQKRTWSQPRGSDLPPSDIRKVLSNENTRKDSGHGNETPKELVIDGTRYRAVNVACIYSVSFSHRTTMAASLIDRGANGGIAGDDVRVIDKTMWMVDVRGINNHEVSGLPIATVGAVILTQHGPVIAIMPQYAYLGHGKTIHSATQLESYQNDVNDRSVKVHGGLQRILTLDGYVIPINIIGGLPYIKMRPYTDAEWDALPHVILTSDMDWDPSVLDHTLDDDEHWYDAICDLERRPYTSMFDHEGNYLGRITVQTAARLSSSASVSPSDGCDVITDALDTVPSDDLDVIIERCVFHATLHSFQAQMDNFATCPRTVTTKEPNYETLHPYFGWLPTDVVKETFARTTQYARMPMSTHLKKRFKSPYPALNVHRRNEPIATDTVYSDTPAIDGGETHAQLFVGTESLVTDVVGM